ncbi:leucine aminopeptidase-related protein [Hymenobacter swuensis DY53]|uniref:Leucine aminopeptidase-related protein n=1 Tax=Hymenobacter swuensis DY53 TaxID=1227739 RepID=W8EVB6_9BACT|nr:leucine aminopeptidase-related protein [Hymenobacter swuensis DY53]
MLLALGLSVPALAQTKPATTPNPLILKMVEEISEKNLRDDIDKLVSFGTRHTLSDTKSKKRGIGASRNWVEGEFRKYSKASGGRLKVE